MPTGRGIGGRQKMSFVQPTTTRRPIRARIPTSPNKIFNANLLCLAERGADRSVPHGPRAGVGDQGKS